MSGIEEATKPSEEVPQEWTFPTRTCRICFEAVVPTVSMYPPGVPARFQKPVVEYRSDEEYGRLLKPCLCRGSQRYIHEHCLRQQRTLGQRENSLWKCPTCAYEFNFQRLNTQRLLSSRMSVVGFTLCFLLIMIFLLGFIADPIINFYLDPWDTIKTNDYWETTIEEDDDGALSTWGAHFMKGFVSMGLVGFVKTLALNPWHWWHWRSSGLAHIRNRTAASGQDRMSNISWIAIVIGICSAFYLFYEWVKTIISMSLQHLGNHIVDTQLPGDDDDIKPPAGWEAPAPPPSETEERNAENARSNRSHPMPGLFDAAGTNTDSNEYSHNSYETSHPFTDDTTGIGAAQRQGWSFTNL